MHGALFSVLVALIVSVGGTGGGTLVTCLVKRTGDRLSAALMGVSAGIMASMVFLDMVPESLEMSVSSALLGIALGAAIMLLFIRLVPHRDAGELDEQTVQDYRQSGLKRSGMMIAVGIAIHNLPQGIAIGSGIVSGEAFGLHLAVLLLLHNIPEGMAMAIPLKLGGVRMGKILLLAVFAALPTVIGAVLGSLAANISQGFVAGSIGFAAGAIAYLTLSELLPQAMRFKKGMFTVWFIVLGLFLGVAVHMVAGH
ncbi:MAG: ZIP family metal transporter [Christensenellaceae bacterium]|jgi:ZIP family zinc transporter